MKRLREQFLAHTAFTLDEDSDIRHGDLANTIQRVTQSQRRPNDSETLLN
jgi:hypothetical protein